MSAETNGYRKMIWGIVLLTFQLHINALTFFPSFVGWLIIISGFRHVEQNFSRQTLSLVQSCLFALLFYSIGEGLISFFSMDSQLLNVLMIYSQAIYLVLELTVFHKLLELVVKGFFDANKQSTAEYYIVRDRRYLRLMGSALVVIIFALTAGTAGMIFIGTIISVIARLYLLTILTSIKNEERVSLNQSLHP